MNKRYVIKESKEILTAVDRIHVKGVKCVGLVEGVESNPHDDDNARHKEMEIKITITNH